MAKKCECYNNKSVLLELITSSKKCDITKDSEFEVKVKPLPPRPITGEITSRSNTQNCKFIDPNSKQYVDRVSEKIVSIKQKEIKYAYTIQRLNGPEQTSKISTIVVFKDDWLDLLPGYSHDANCEISVNLS